VVFSNFLSTGIQIDGIGVIAPQPKGTLAQLGVKALIAETFACSQTATVGGILLT
jgi:nucleoside permease NupC